METIRTFLEQQPLLSLFLVIGLGYAVGSVNLRGFALGIGAVLFVGLGVGMLAPEVAPPALLGSLGLVMFVYGIGIQYGRQFFAGLTSPFGLKVNGLALLSHLVVLGVCYIAYSVFSVAPAHVAGLFAGALTSTPALHAAIGAAGNNDPALGYSVAYPFGLIGPILCMYFANVLLKPKLPAATSTGLDLREIVVRSAQVIGRPLSELSAALPTGVQIVVVRQAHQNRVPAPDLVLNHDDVVAVAGESAEALEKAQALIGESVTGRITMQARTSKDANAMCWWTLWDSFGGWRSAEPTCRTVTEPSRYFVDCWALRPWAAGNSFGRIVPTGANWRTG